MARHTNKRRNTRRRRQTRGRRRSQHGGSWFSSKQEDITELQEKINKCKQNIPEWEAEIAKLQNDMSAPKQNIFSSFFGSKSATESEQVAPNSGSEQVAPNSGSEQVAPNSGSEEVATVREEGEYKEGEQGGGSRRRRRRHRKK